jgi:hypothetical protein
MFEHISIFFSIILGLGIVHLLGGLSLILDARVKTKLYWVHLLWTFNLLFLISLVWFGNFVLNFASQLGISHYFILLAYSISIYLMCGLLFPVQGEEITDFEHHFNENKLRFYAIGILFVLTDAIDGLLEAKTLNIALNPFQFGTLTVYFILFVIGMKSSSRWFHGLTAVIFMLGMLGFLSSIIEIDSNLLLK